MFYKINVWHQWVRLSWFKIIIWYSVFKTKLDFLILSQLRCPNFIVTYFCPSYAAQWLIFTYFCPGYVAQFSFLLVFCPCYAAQLFNFTYFCVCPIFQIYRFLSQLRCPIFQFNPFLSRLHCPIFQFYPFLSRLHCPILLIFVPVTLPNFTYFCPSYAAQFFNLPCFFVTVTLIDFSILPILFPVTLTKC